MAGRDIDAGWRSGSRRGPKLLIEFKKERADGWGRENLFATINFILCSSRDSRFFILGLRIFSPPRSSENKTEHSEPAKLN